MSGSLAESERKLRCQRIGCDAYYLERDNHENGCRYHSGPMLLFLGQPIFHDGGKEWSCCKKKSHDFSLFLAIPGCTTGKHSSEKPLPKAAPSPSRTNVALGNSLMDAAKASCARCKQGFFCSDHAQVSGLQTRPAPVPAILKPETAPKAEAPAKEKAPAKVLDLNAKQTCRHKGCGATFAEKENHDSACNYHPGPAVFHDRSKGWACCDQHVKEFDEFMLIPACTKGWHDANPDK
eukprot:jgi/Mesen1/1797/ME000014S01205